MNDHDRPPLRTQATTCSSCEPPARTDAAERGAIRRSPSPTDRFVLDADNLLLCA